MGMMLFAASFCTISIRSKKRRFFLNFSPKAAVKRGSIGKMDLSVQPHWTLLRSKENSPNQRNAGMPLCAKRNQDNAYFPVLRF
jgi:hypothetical protein